MTFSQSVRKVQNKGNGKPQKPKKTKTTKLRTDHYNSDGFFVDEYDDQIEYDEFPTNKQSRTQNTSNVLAFKTKIQTIANIKPQSDEQQQYIDSINKNKVTLVLGNAGTGKTLLGLHQTIKLINKEESSIERLIYTRILVDCLEENSIGFLTGDKNEKLDPYKRPALDNLQRFMTESEAVNLFTFGKAEIEIPEFMEGRSLSNTLVFLDEAQAASKARINMLIERIDDTSKIIIAGAANQRKNKGQEPLTSLAEIFERNPCTGFGVVRLTQNFRNPTYREWEENLNQWLGR